MIVADVPAHPSTAAAASPAVERRLAELEHQLAPHETVLEITPSTVQVLATTLDRRNPDTAGHSQRVALSAEILAKRIGLSPVEVEKVRIAGLLHDVGKVGVPEAVLNKNGKLDQEEFAKIREHAKITRDILEQIRFLDGYEDITNMAGQHHEKLSGKGYPFG